MDATITPAPIFFTVPAQELLKLRFAEDTIAQYFNVVQGGNDLCSDSEICHYFYFNKWSTTRTRAKTLSNQNSRRILCIRCIAFVAICHGHGPNFERYVSLFRSR